MKNDGTCSVCQRLFVVLLASKFYKSISHTRVEANLGVCIVKKVYLVVYTINEG